MLRSEASRPRANGTPSARARGEAARTRDSVTSAIRASLPGTEATLAHAHHHPHGDHHGHAHAHAHAGHAHAQGPATYDRAFALGAAMNVAFVAVEAAAGWYADSVALLADAAHNLGDVAGLLLAWWVARLGTRPPTATRTYGLRRASILGALANAAFLLVTAALLAAEAARRFGAPGDVPAGIVIWTAAAGIAVNAATAALFFRGRHGDLNVRGAYLHMAADAAVSLGVVVSGVLIGLTGWPWLDPLAGLAIAGIIAWGTWGLFRDALDLSLDAVPAGVDAPALGAALRGLPGVEAMHDLHVWALGTTEAAATAHLVRAPGADPDAILLAATEAARRAGIGHATFQVETAATAEACAGCGA